MGIRSPDGLVVGHPGVLGSIPKRERRVPHGSQVRESISYRAGVGLRDAPWRNRQRSGFLSVSCWVHPPFSRVCELYANWYLNKIFFSRNIFLLGVHFPPPRFSFLTKETIIERGHYQHIIQSRDRGEGESRGLSPVVQVPWSALLPPKFRNFGSQTASALLAVPAGNPANPKP